nr:MAG TPA: hypothetical protein [Caudoviricetes sp.]DAW90935.1 MAG TPA: hypothetical protein [Caudoviricetes sp.]
MSWLHPEEITIFLIHYKNIIRNRFFSSLDNQHFQVSR